MFARRSILLGILGAALLLAVPFASAELSVKYGDYTIHYNAFTTDTLQPQIAKLYRITRSRNRGMLNISVLKEVPVGVPRSVKADVSGTATNLTGQLKELDIRELRDGDAVYYIATFPVSHEETLDFSLTVEPEGAAQPYNVKFRRQFFTD